MTGWLSVYVKLNIQSETIHSITESGQIENVTIQAHSIQEKAVIAKTFKELFSR